MNLSNHKFVATVRQTDHVDRQVHFDSMGMNGFGFVFIRDNGETEFVNARTVDSMSTEPAAQTVGAAQ